jgi:hypothetical protein
VSPFVQGGLVFGIISPAAGPQNWLLGLAAGAGAEWIFIQHLGLIVNAMVQYGHAHYAFSGTFGGGDTNIDTIGFSGNVGVTVHF